MVVESEGLNAINCGAGTRYFRSQCATCYQTSPATTYDESVEHNALGRGVFE